LAIHRHQSNGFLDRIPPGQQAVNMRFLTKIGTNFKSPSMQRFDFLTANTMDEIHPHVHQLLSAGKHHLPSSITRKRAKSGRSGASAREMDFSGRTLDYSEWSTSGTIKVTDAIDVARTVMQCTSLVRNISRSNSLLFSMRQDRRTNAPILWYRPSGHDFLLRIIDKNTASLDTHSPYCTFSPYVELFLKVRAEFLQNTSSLPMERDNTEKLVSELNRAIESLRNEARSEKLCKGLDCFQRNIRKNYGGVKRYLTSICENRQDYELFDIKLFFPYAGKENPDHALRTENNPLHRYRLEWFKKIGKIIPKGSLIGHVWSIQYGFRFAWHYRVIAVLRTTSDNSPRSWFPDVVQETWADTVKGHTYCIPALIAPRRTNNPGNRYKSHMAEPNRTLTNIASALTKPDYFAKATLSHGKRTLGRGVLHSKKTCHQKRPIGHSRDVNFGDG
jgi:hypothetical protein